MIKTVIRYLEILAKILLYFGGTIVIIQTIWISYGVFVRYVLNSPDSMVTEATALMLVPVAFLGLAYALSKDAYPKVTLLHDLMPDPLKLIIDKLNLLIMTLTGLFFSVAACEALIRSYNSGSASEVLLWPRFYFWIPVAISLIVFTLLALARLLDTHSTTDKEA